MSRKLKINLAAGIAAVIVLGAGWYGVSHYYLYHATLSAPLTNGTEYRDPDNYFTLEIPDGWHVTREVSSATPSQGQEQFHITTVMTTFAPNDPASAADPSVFIYLESANDASSRRWACSAHPIAPTTITRCAGL